MAYPPVSGLSGMCLSANRSGKCKNVKICFCNWKTGATAAGQNYFGIQNTSIYLQITDFKKAYDSVRREVLYNILIEFWIPMKLVRLIKMCLNEKYSKVRIGEHLSDNFLIQNGLK